MIMAVVYIGAILYLIGFIGELLSADHEARAACDIKYAHDRERRAAEYARLKSEFDNANFLKIWCAQSPNFHNWNQDKKKCNKHKRRHKRPKSQKLLK